MKALYSKPIIGCLLVIDFKTNIGLREIAFSSPVVEISEPSSLDLLLGRLLVLLFF